VKSRHGVAWALPAWGVCFILFVGGVQAQPAYLCREPLGLPDADGDGVRDACDCAAADPNAFWIPSEVETLTVPSASTVVWDGLPISPGSNLTYDVLRGDLSDFKAGGLGTEVCLADDVAATTAPAGTDPPSGRVWFLLVRANNRCGGGPFADGQVHSACTLPGATPPPAIGRVRGEANGLDYVLSWPAEPAASTYAVYRIGPGVASERYGDCVASGLITTTWTDVGVLNGSPPTALTYIVVARNAGGESALGWDGLGRPRLRLSAPCP